MLCWLACPGGYRFTTQPPGQLNCNPVGTLIILQCISGSTSDHVTWYWSQSVCDAGINGTAILPGDSSDAYAATMAKDPNNVHIKFIVTQSTLGYYWCEISNAVNVSLRTSTITPVLQPTTNTSLPLCTTEFVTNLHTHTPVCAAAVGPPVLYTSICTPPLSSSDTVSQTTHVDIVY